MSRVVKFEIILENCESINVPLDKLETFYLGNIQEHKLCNKGNFEMFKMREAKETIIILNDNFFYEPLYDRDTEVSAYECLKCRDITTLDITYDDGTSDYIYVVYDDGDDGTAIGNPNVNQLNQFIDRKLHILICADEKERENWLKQFEVAS